jgi:uncharacterized membrane protein YtjA (UPF0391 family)
MVRRALVFLVLAVVAGVLGYGDLTAGVAPLAQVLFYVFLSLFVAGVALHMIQRAA